MAAAYAALVSLMDLIEQIQHHPNPPLSLDQRQAKSLTEKIRFLQRFMEDFYSRGLSQEIQGLESRIRDTAHAAEDVIESPILLVREVRMRRWIPAHRISSLSNLSMDLYEGLERVIKDMKLIEEDAAKKKRGDNQLLPPPRSLLPPLGSSLIEKTTTSMVGFDNISNRILELLTLNPSRRDVVMLVGMGGAGKTTLARNIYEKPLIVEHFDTRLWVTISQECAVMDLLLCLSNQMSREALSRKSEGDLGDLLYKSLFGRRYLIVMDDVWSIEAWDKLKCFFPDNNNGSRIMVTTRLSKLTFDSAGAHSHVVEVDLLDENSSWDLLCKKVFAETSCPHELEEIGREIARNCRGLPLSIVTIGGLLAKSDKTREYMEYVAENLSSLVNSEDDERCLKILSLSYINLPVHLKPCFIYMGLFPEDQRIRPGHLIRLWVAEGFLKPISGKALEVVGEDYLNDLVERNLVSVATRGFTGKIRSCIVHDLLRDLCLREADREKFFSVARIDNLQANGISKTQRRIAIHRSTLKEENTPVHGIPFSSSYLRSCIIDSEEVFYSISLRSIHRLRILAGARGGRHYMSYDIVPPANSRFLCLNNDKYISSFWWMSWNLQTLILEVFEERTAPLDIWKMPQLRHVKIDSIDLLDPPAPSTSDGGRRLVLKNLQTLKWIRNFKCGEDVVERIPNIKKLRIFYEDNASSSDDYRLNNLGLLQTLESLTIRFFIQPNWFVGLKLPSSLEQLTLERITCDDDMLSEMIGGSLPLLQVLMLNYCKFVRDEWNPVEGQFRLLKYLELSYCYDLKYWNTDSTHFPSLEHLRIAGPDCLEEFPSDIGHIASLRFIDLDYVKNSVIISAKQMLEEQEEQYGNTELQIRLQLKEEPKEFVDSLASNNFKIYY